MYITNDQLSIEILVLLAWLESEREGSKFGSSGLTRIGARGIKIWFFWLD